MSAGLRRGLLLLSPFLLPVAQSLGNALAAGGLDVFRNLIEEFENERNVLAIYLWARAVEGRRSAADRLVTVHVVLQPAAGGYAVVARGNTLQVGSAIGDPAEVAARTIALLACVTLVGAIVTRFVADRRGRNATVQVDLDASRRWRLGGFQRRR